MRLAPASTYGRLVSVFAMLAIVFVAMATDAVAYWTTRGTAATAATGGAPLAVTVTGSTSGALTPGGTADLVVGVTNPNSFSVRVVAVSANGSTTVSSASGTCVRHGVGLQQVPQPTVTVAALGSVTYTIPAAVVMAAGAESGCQGARFSFPLTAAVSR